MTIGYETGPRVYSCYPRRLESQIAIMGCSEGKFPVSFATTEIKIAAVSAVSAREI